MSNIKFTILKKPVAILATFYEDKDKAIKKAKYKSKIYKSNFEVVEYNHGYLVVSNKQL